MLRVKAGGTETAGTWSAGRPDKKPVLPPLAVLHEEGREFTPHSSTLQAEL